MGSQRIVSKLGSSDIFTIRNPLTDTTANKQNFIPKLNELTGKIKARYDSLGVAYKGISQGNAGLITSIEGRIPTPLNYYFHSDHLGSSSLITNQSGDVVQHLEYIPFGEVFIDERPSTGTWSTPYKFNAKELDEETGLYYYGARYYDPRSSVWISVDPLAEKYPNVSSYVYCLDNPVKHVDPDGKWVASVFLQGSIGVGVGYGLYGAQQSGIAYDRHGKTHFQMTGVAHITNQNLSGSVKNQNVVWGADVGISVGASVDWKSDSFVGSLSGTNSASVPGPTIKGELGVGLSGNENSASISLGLQAGGTINSMGMKVDNSVSLTNNQAAKVSNMTDVVTERWAVKGVQQQFDKKGNVTGYSGKVNTMDSKGNLIPTGINVSCGTVKDGNKVSPNNIWMSNEYKKSINGK